MQQPPTERLLSRQMCALFQHGSCEACLLTVVVLGQMTSVKIRCADEASKINNTIGRSFMSPMGEPVVGPTAEPLVSPTRGKSGRFSGGQWSGWVPQPESMGIPEDESFEGINNWEGDLFSGKVGGSPPEDEAWNQKSPTIEGSTDELDLVGRGINLNPADELQQGITINTDPLRFSNQNNDLPEDEQIEKQPGAPLEVLEESKQKQRELGATIVPQMEPISFEHDHLTPTEMEGIQFDLEERVDPSLYPPMQESKAADLIITAETGRKSSKSTLAWILVTVIVLSIMIIICLCCCCFLLNTSNSLAKNTGSDPPNHEPVPGQNVQGSEYPPSPPIDDANAEYKRSQLLFRAARYGFESSNLSLSGQGMEEL